ncbi:MAG: phage tail baseplate protein, partial [Alphaproteobacteria bacterium]
FELPWRQAHLQVGDRVRLAGSASMADCIITSIEDGATRRIAARALPQHVRYPNLARLPVPPDGGKSAVRGKPCFQLLDLPLWPGAENPADQFRLAACARPWSGVSAFASPESSGFEPRATLADHAVMGELGAPLPGGPSGRLLPGQALEIALYRGELRSASLAQVLNGANSALLGTADGSWEILQFLNAEETASNLWRLTGLLRGQCGTDPEASEARTEGTPFILLDEAVAPAGLKAQEAGLSLNWRIGTSGEDFSDQFFSTVERIGGLRARLPLAPVHLRATLASDGGLHVGWTRRGRIDADSWLAPDIPLGEEREAYRVEIRSGNALVRTAEVTQPAWIYDAASRLADLGGTTAPFDIAVAMISATVGAGAPVRRKLEPDIFS